MSDIDHARCTCEALVVSHKACEGRGCGTTVPDCKDGNVCPRCCVNTKILLGSGWMMGIPMVAFKPHKEDVRGILDAVLSDDVFGLEGMGWEPIPNEAGTKVNREAWWHEWHLGIEESADADGSIVFKGLAEDHVRGLKVRLPSAWVSRIRQKVCPQAIGRSE